MADIKLYNVWVTRFGSSANNAGIIGDTQAVRSSWTTGKLKWIPANLGTQENYLFAATDDAAALIEIARLFNLKHPGNKRPLSGKSYLRNCRVEVKK